MFFIRKKLLVILLLTAQPLFAAGIEEMLTRSESEFCQSKGSGNDDLSTYIDCLKDEESKVDKAMKAAFDRSLATVQSDEWLLPNVDYENSNSNIVKKIKRHLSAIKKAGRKRARSFVSLPRPG